MPRREKRRSRDEEASRPEMARDDLRACSGAKNGASRRPSAAVRERETSDHEDTVRERDRAVIAA